jgi:hypothetical protein
MKPTTILLIGATIALSALAKDKKTDDPAVPVIPRDKIIRLLQIQKQMAPLQAAEQEAIKELQGICGKDYVPTWADDGSDMLCKAPPKPPEPAKK